MKGDAMTFKFYSAVLALVILTGCSTPVDPETAIAKAQIARDKREYSVAIVALKDLLQANPDNAEARYVLGLAYNDIGDYKSGEQELRRARELGFDAVKVIPAHGRALLMIGAFKELLDQVRPDLPASDRVNAELLTLRGHALIALGRRGEAASSFEQALAKYPDFSGALLGQARLAFGERKREESLSLIDRVVARDPNSVEAWLMKGEFS